MDVREKLVDMIFDSLCRHIDKSCKLAENIADDLISNGVTVQEWVSVKDRLPEENGRYLTANKRYNMIEITEVEAETLVDTIELYIYDIIRENEDIDNINWLANIMSVYEKCKNGR